MKGDILWFVGLQSPCGWFCVHHQNPPPDPSNVSLGFCDGIKLWLSFSLMLIKRGFRKRQSLILTHQWDDLGGAINSCWGKSAGGPKLVEESRRNWRRWCQTESVTVPMALWRVKSAYNGQSTTSRRSVVSENVSRFAAVWSVGVRFCTDKTQTCKERNDFFVWRVTKSASQKNKGVLQPFMINGRTHRTRFTLTWNGLHVRSFVYPQEYKGPKKRR